MGVVSAALCFGWARDGFGVQDVVEALAVSRHASVVRVFGVGHSLGGAVLMAAQLAKAVTFDKVREITQVYVVCGCALVFE